MAVLKLFEYPDPVLTQKAETVTKIDDELKTLLKDMLETMYADHGVGLAAPQVGILKRVIVIDPFQKEDGDGPCTGEGRACSARQQLRFSKLCSRYDHDQRTRTLPASAEDGYHVDE